MLNTDEVFETPIDRLKLTGRSENCLKAAEIHTVEQLQKLKKDLPKIPNLGKRSLAEIKDALNKYNTTESNPIYQALIEKINKTQAHLSKKIKTNEDKLDQLLKHIELIPNFLRVLDLHFKQMNKELQSIHNKLSDN